jgi:hypothetical protein
MADRARSPFTVPELLQLLTPVSSSFDRHFAIPSGSTAKLLTESSLC